MNDVALAMELLGITRIGPEHKDIMLPLMAKTEGDRKERSSIPTDYSKTNSSSDCSPTPGSRPLE
jgi:hypothetical protein